ncbi:hypothetical protein [Streptomyces rhizosphaericus]|uniref:Uncharacterized protein n=1 Tax=Streptomyces rhizosphaericus TaxID=114699 RepID=A0ABN1QP12_9ACTN|nr:hypothetical protein [Streptomyces cangkringensis]
MSAIGIRLRAPGARLRARGLVWLVARQHRAALWAGLAVVVAIAAYIVWQRAGMVGYARAHDVQGCADWSWKRLCHGREISPDTGTTRWPRRSAISATPTAHRCSTPDGCSSRCPC